MKRPGRSAPPIHLPAQVVEILAQLAPLVRRQPRAAKTVASPAMFRLALFGAIALRTGTRLPLAIAGGLARMGRSALLAVLQAGHPGRLGMPRTGGQAQCQRHTGARKPCAGGTMQGLAMPVSVHFH